jgi:hypothetical protein
MPSISISLQHQRALASYPLFSPAFNSVLFLLLVFLSPSSGNTDLSDAQPSADLASAIEWVQSFRSSAAAAANACTQQSACLQAPSSQGECLYSSAAHLILGNDSRPTNSSCSQEQTDAYRSIVDTMHNRFSTHSAILQPLLLSLKNLNQLSSPPPSPSSTLSSKPPKPLASQSLCTAPSFSLSQRVQDRFLCSPPRPSTTRCCARCKGMVRWLSCRRRRRLSETSPRW